MMKSTSKKVSRSFGLLVFLSVNASGYVVKDLTAFGVTRRPPSRQPSSSHRIPFVSTPTSLHARHSAATSTTATSALPASQRVLVTPPPPTSSGTKNRRQQSPNNDLLAQQQQDKQQTKPNWIFLYPEPCSCLFTNNKTNGTTTTIGASVRSANIHNIPPDSCQGGYYGHDAKIDPNQVLKEGFQRRGNDWDLLNHVLQKGNSAFRGTTKQIVYPEDGVGAASFAGEDGYVYEVTCVPSWDVNKHIQGRRKVSDIAIGKDRFSGNMVLGEHEYAVSSYIPPEHIKRYGKVVRSAGSGTLFVPRTAWVENPNWNPAFCKYSISDSTCQTIQVLLQELDLDGNGTLDLEEFKAAMEKNTAIFKAAEATAAVTDTSEYCNDDDELSSDDYDGPAINMLDVETIFHRFDFDNSGTISAEELRKFLMQSQTCGCL